MAGRRVRTGWSRRGFLTGKSSQRPGGAVSVVDGSTYAGWVRDFRGGLFLATARMVNQHGARELRIAQRAYLDTLPPRSDHRGFRPRLAAAVLHAETLARFGWNQSSDIGLLEDPCQSLPDRWIIGLPPSLREDCAAAWGDRAAADPRRILFREVVLAAARPLLRMLAVHDASNILELARRHDDPAIEWQLANAWAFRARYVRERGLWRQVLDILGSPAVRTLVPAEVGASSPRAVARAMSDPDDANLRFALVHIGMNQREDARHHLDQLRPDLRKRLRLPHRLLQGELLLEDRQLRRATEVFREAADSGPGSQAAAAALVAALLSSGRQEEAAALGRDWLTGAFPRGIDVDRHAWLSFLLTWARRQGPEFEWLRSFVTT